MAEAIANVRVEDFASQEDYYVAIKKIQDSYEDQLRMQENELNKAIKNNKELYDEDWTNYHNATGYKISDTENFVTSFKDSLLGGLLNSQENSANFSEVIKASADALTDSLKTAAKSYFEAIEAAMNAAGTSTRNFANDATESINKVVSESKDAVKEMNKITSDMDSNFKSLIDSVTGWQKEYSIQLGLMEKANLSLIESFNKLLECLSIDPETGNINYDVSKAIENKNANNDSNSSSNSSSSSSAMVKYDTGGYTGNWGDAGKLAVLHEKELVLNSEDTTNVLTAV
nr:MAG TPA: minor tail protein [Caudoviricetes sp.]